MNDKFVHVTYIRTTQEKLWDALTKPEFLRVYWGGVVQESEWVKGSKWKMVQADGKVSDAGEILESDPPKRMVIKWRNEAKPEFSSEGNSRCTFTLEPTGDLVKLSVLHEMEIPVPGSKFVAAVSNGWPLILSSLKSYLETGVPLDLKTVKTCK